MSGIVESVVAAWQAGYKLFHPARAKVIEVKKYNSQTKVKDTHRGTLSASAGFNEKLDGIGWMSAGKPAADANFILLRCDNIDDRRVGIAFDRYECLETIVGDKVNIEVSDDSCKIKHDDVEFVLDFQAKSVTIKLGRHKLEGDSSGWKMSGDVTFDSPVTFKKKITAEDEISAKKSIKSQDDVLASNISLKLHTHPYTDTPAGASVTSPPN